MPSALAIVTRCWCTSSPETEMGFAISHRKHQQSFVYLKRIWDQQLWAALWTHYPHVLSLNPELANDTARDKNLRFERLKRWYKTSHLAGTSANPRAPNILQPWCIRMAWDLISMAEITAMCTTCKVDPVTLSCVEWCVFKFKRTDPEGKQNWLYGAAKKIKKACTIDSRWFESVMHSCKTETVRYLLRARPRLSAVTWRFKWL